MEIKALFVGDNNEEEDRFAVRLLHSLPKGSSVNVTSLNSAPEGKFDLVVIDSTQVVNFVHAITYMKKKYPRAIFVGVGLSLTWARIREAFRAGVNDYISKSIKESELRDLIDELIK